MYKNFTIVIPTYNSTKYLFELLKSTLKLKYCNEIVIIDDNSNMNEFQNLKNISEMENFKSLNIKIYRNNKNLGGFYNKRKGVTLSSNEVIYQIDSDNIVTKRTIKFLNKLENLNLILPGEIFFPSKINLFKKYKYLENIIFFRNNDVLFTKKNQTLDLNDVNFELSNENSKKFKDRTLKSILNIGNPIFLKSDYIKFTEKASNEQAEKLVACSIALSYFYLINFGKIVFNKNISHFHRMRSDSAWNEGGELSKISDLYFLEKIQKGLTKKLQRKQKKYFITYGTKDFLIAKSHLVSLAKESGFFDDVISCNQRFLSNDFKNKYRNILREPRGAGYWVWKHEIINNVLNKINKNDIVIYCDAGSSFNYFAKERFELYIDMLNESEFGNFRIECEEKHKEYMWTTKQLFDYFSIDKDSDIYQSTQLEATQLIFQKSEHTQNLFMEYSNVLNYDQKLITDDYNNIEQQKGFVENRHDQSIFSLLSKKMGGVIVPNETHFSHLTNMQKNYPFLAVRKHGHGLLDTVRYIFNQNDIKTTPVYFLEKNNK